MAIELVGVERAKRWEGAFRELNRLGFAWFRALRRISRYPSRRARDAGRLLDDRAESALVFISLVLAHGSLVLALWVGFRYGFLAWLWAIPAFLAPIVPGGISEALRFIDRRLLWSPNQLVSRSRWGIKILRVPFATVATVSGLAAAFLTLFPISILYLVFGTLTVLSAGVYGLLRAKERLGLGNAFALAGLGLLIAGIVADA